MGKNMKIEQVLLYKEEGSIYNSLETINKMADMFLDADIEEEEVTKDAILGKVISIKNSVDQLHDLVMKAIYSDAEMEKIRQLN